MNAFDTYVLNTLSTVNYFRLDAVSGATDLKTGAVGTPGGSIAIGALLDGPPVIGSESLTCTDFNGSTQYIDTLANAYVDGTVKTLFGWMKRDANPDNDCIIGGNAGSSTAPALTLPGAGDSVRWRIQNGNSGATSSTTWVAAWSSVGNGSWGFWTLILDMAADTAEFFTNAVSQGVKSGLSLAYPGAGTMRIGGLGSGSPLDPFDGKQQRVGLVDGRLTQAQITALFNLATVNTLPSIKVTPDTPALVHQIDCWDGTHLRAGPDEKNILEQTKQFTFETEMPGGFGPGSLVLPRPDIWDPADGALLASLHTVDQADRNVYEGRVTGIPKTGVNEIEIQTEGWVKNTDDDPTAQMLFINRDMGAWTGYLSTRKVNLASTVTRLRDGDSVATGPQSGQPEIQLTMDPPTTNTARTGIMFDSGPAVGIGRFYSLWSPLANLSASNVDWTAGARISADPATMSPNDQILTSPVGAIGAADITATDHKRRFAEFFMQHAVTDGTSTDSILRVLNLIICGDHGLTLRGSFPSTAGYYVTDMIQYIITNYCPLLSYTPDSIEQTSFIVPHADYRDPDTTAKTMLDKLVVFGGNANYPLDYFVYDGRIFNAKSPGTYGTQWRMRREAGADPKDQGPDADERWNQVVGVYNAGDGIQNTVGPVGSGCDYETDLLKITDPDHVWNRIGQPHGKRLDVGVMNQLGTILLCQLALAEKNRNQWRGSFVAAGEQLDKSGAPFPPYLVRSGDSGVVEDDMDTRERRIVHTKYDDRKRATNVDVGATPDRFDTMLARAGVKTAGLITS